MITYVRHIIILAACSVECRSQLAPAAICSEALRPASVGVGHRCEGVINPDCVTLWSVLTTACCDMVGKHLGRGGVDGLQRPAA